MNKTAKFYTADQKDVLKEYSDSKDAKRTTITESTGARILDALGEQQNTLQNIERILQHIENAIVKKKIDNTTACGLYNHAIPNNHIISPAPNVLPSETY